MREQEPLFRRLFINLWGWLGGDTGPRIPPARQLPPVSTETAPRAHITSQPPRPISSGPLPARPQPAPITQPSRSRVPMTITVREGDTLFSIADEVNASVRSLIQANNLASQKIYIGQTLRLPDSASLPESRRNRPTQTALPKQRESPQASRRSILRRLGALDPNQAEQTRLDLGLESGPSAPTPTHPKPPVTAPLKNPNIPTPEPARNQNQPPKKHISPPPPDPFQAAPTAQVSTAKPASKPPQPSTPAHPKPTPKPETKPRLVVAPPIPAPESAPQPDQKKQTPSPTQSRPNLKPVPGIEQEWIQRPKYAPVIPRVRPPHQPPVEAVPPTKTLKSFPPDAIQGIYLVYHVLGNQLEQERLAQFIKDSYINAVVIDLKNEAGLLSYHSQIPLAAGLDANRRLAVDMQQLVTWFKAQSVYTIGRIATFRDSRLAMAYPELAIRQSGTHKIWRDMHNIAWVDPFAYDVWSYNLQLAQEAISFGFDEVQFDALRFPTSDTNGTPIFAQSVSPETRINAITSFLSAAHGAIATSGTKLSATIVGHACWRDDDALVGQDITRMAPYLDFLSPQLYPSTLERGILGYASPFESIREITCDALHQAATRMAQSTSRCRIRPWIQDFPDMIVDQRPFGKRDIQNQISGAVDGAAAGFLAWNPDSIYSQDAYKTTE